jgi:tetratricopeptide (TPR) repeat protein
MISKWIFYSVVPIVVISMFVAGISGSKQDAGYKADNDAYLQATKYIQNAQGQEALTIMKALYVKYPEATNIVRFLGLSYGLVKDYPSAVNAFDKVVELKPFMVKDAIFNAQFGEMLYNNKEYAKAKAYFAAALDNNINETYKPTVMNYLTRITVIEAREAQ